MSRDHAIALIAGLLALSLCWATPLGAAAQATISPDSLPLGNVPAESLVFVLGDPDGFLTSPPAKATATGAGGSVSFELIDDGQGPDAQPGDSVYTGSATGYPKGEVHISLTDQAGRSLWVDTVPIEGNMGTPRISAVLTSSHVRISLDTVGDIGAEEDPAPVGDVVEAPPPDEPPDEPPPDDGRGPRGQSSSKGQSQSGAGGFGWLALLGAALLGFLGGLAARPARRLLGRKGTSRKLSNAAPPPPAPLPDAHLALRGQQQIWGLPGEAPDLPALANLARSWAAGGTVLLVPQQDNRAPLSQLIAGVHGVYWLELDQPETRQILRAASTLSACGGDHLPCLLLVDGPGALEEPLEDEPLDAVLSELLEDLEESAPPGLATVVLSPLAPLGEREPTMKLRRAESGLERPDGTPMVPPPVDSPTEDGEPPTAGLPTLAQVAQRSRWPLSMLRAKDERLRWAAGLAEISPVLPAPDGDGTVWSLPDAEAIHTCFMELLTTLSDHGTVLVVPTEEHREAAARAVVGKHTVHWLEQDCPEPRRLLGAAKQLAKASRSLGLPGPVLLIEGVDALEDALEDESPDAVLDELLADAPDGVSVLALCKAEDLEAVEPTLTATRGEGGLLSPEGAPLFGRDPGVE